MQEAFPGSTPFLRIKDFKLSDTSGPLVDDPFLLARHLGIPVLVIFLVQVSVCLIPTEFFKSELHAGIKIKELRNT